MSSHSRHEAPTRRDSLAYLAKGGAEVLRYSVEKVCAAGDVLGSLVADGLTNEDLTIDYDRCSVRVVFYSGITICIHVRIMECFYWCVAENRIDLRLGVGCRVVWHEHEGHVWICNCVIGHSNEMALDISFTLHWILLSFFRLRSSDSALHHLFF